METWALEYYHVGFIWLNTWAGVIVPRFGSACLSGGIFIAGVWLVCRFAPRLPVGTRCWLWWLACLKLLVGLFWMDPVTLPILPAAHPGKASIASVKPERSPASAPSQAASPADNSSLPAGSSDTRAVAMQTRPDTSLNDLEWQQPNYSPTPYAMPHIASTPSLALGLLLAWIIGVTLSLNRIERRLRRLRVLLRRADREVPPSCAAPAVEIARLLRLRRTPRLVISSETASPLVTGLLRPTVILPAPDHIALSPFEARMVLAHEMTHVRRGDLWLTWVPLFAQCLFFFFPPLWLAVREWMAAREVACDAAAIRLTGASVQDYGRLLIRIPSTPGPYHSAGALYATGAFVEVKRRLELIKRFCRHNPGVSRPVLLAVSLLAVVCLLPWRVAAHSRHPRFALFADNRVRYQVTDLGVYPSNNSLGDINGITEAGVVYGHVWRAVKKPPMPDVLRSLDYLWVWEGGKRSEITDPDMSMIYRLSVNAQDQITGADNTGRLFLYDKGRLRFLDKGVGATRKIEKPAPPEKVRFWNGKKLVDLVVWNELGHNASGQRLVEGSDYNPTSSVVEDFTFLLDNGHAKRLGYLPGDLSCRAAALNNRGLVVGFSERLETTLTFKGFTPTPRTHAVLWHDGKIADLGALPDKTCMYPSALNDANQVIGTAHTESAFGLNSKNQALFPDVENAPPFFYTAFLYTDGEMYDLNDLIPANSGWQIDQPTALNNAGQIIGHGTYKGKEHYFLLSPLAPAAKQKTN
jgi:beta-lactamase regulating signal transducer with metallopeptidase domain